MEFFYKSNAEKYANEVQLGTKLTPCQFWFIDKDMKIDLPPTTNWSTTSQPDPSIITKEECDRDPRLKNPPPTCKFTVKWIKERQPERFNGMFKFNGAQLKGTDGRKSEWCFGFDHPGITIILAIVQLRPSCLTTNQFQERSQEY